MALRKKLYHLYHGHDVTARAFRFAILAFDVITILFFIASSLMRDEPWIYWVDAAIALFIIADLAARFLIAPKPLALLATS